MSRFGGIAIFVAALFGLMLFAIIRSNRPPADPSQTTKSELAKDAERSGTPASTDEARKPADRMPFTPDQDRALRDLAGSGKTAGEIALEIDRGADEVRDRAAELGVELAKR